MMKIKLILLRSKNKRKKLPKKLLKRLKRTVEPRRPIRSIMTKNGRRDKINWQVQLSKLKLIPPE